MKKKILLAATGIGLTSIAKCAEVETTQVERVVEIINPSNSCQ